MSRKAVGPVIVGLPERTDVGKTQTEGVDLMSHGGDGRLVAVFVFS